MADRRNIIPTPDHDLLIRVDQKVDNLTDKVSLLTDDHEKRIRSIEKYVWKAIGAIAIFNLILGIVMAWYFSKH